MTVRSVIDGSRRCLAIDPGLSGAVALVGGGTIEVTRDFKELRDIAHAINRYAGSADEVVIEKVGARPGQGVCSMFSFGLSTGTAYGALFASSGLVVTEVSPQKWQNWFRRALSWPKEKAFDSREIATSLMPDYKHLFVRKKDHNTADAVLLGVWRLTVLCAPSAC